MSSMCRRFIFKQHSLYSIHRITCTRVFFLPFFLLLLCSLFGAHRFEPVNRKQECAARCSTPQTVQSTKTSCTARTATAASTDRRATVSVEAPAASRWTLAPSFRARGKFRYDRTAISHRHCVQYAE